MLLGLKIPVYNIKVASSSVPKGSLDYNFYILICIVSLDERRILFLLWSTKDPFSLFTLPLLYRTLVTSHHQSLFLLPPASMYKAPSKPFGSVYRCELQMHPLLLVLYVMFL
jgi:hypothetical protein